jgi:hemerythrin-like metal-binding protein
MSLITWNENLSVGVEAVDSQHKRLIQLINETHSAMLEGRSSEQMAMVINALIEYTKSHFAFEEDVFNKFGYSEKEGHILAHQTLTEKVVRYKEKYESGETILGVEMLGFLKDWLIGHIVGVDKRYQSFFIDHGIK